MDCQWLFVPRVLREWQEFSRARVFAEETCESDREDENGSQSLCFEWTLFGKKNEKLFALIIEQMNRRKE